MRQHSVLLHSPSLVNVAGRGRPGAQVIHDGIRAETATLVDAVPAPLARIFAARPESVTATSVQNFGGVLHTVSCDEFTTIVSSQDVSGNNQAPIWGSVSDTVFDIAQGTTLNMQSVSRFSDPDAEPLSITHVSGLLPTGVTFDPATGFLTAAEDADISLSENLVFQADDGQETVRNVGPGKPYATIRAAILAAQDGDTIQIDPGDYIGDVATITAHNLTIKGTSATNRARLFANGVHEADKGILVLESDNVTFENMDFYDAAGPSQNIAGVRHDGGGLTTFRRCGFFDCENGILSSGGATSQVLLEFCEFARNGFGDGFTHNVYFGNHQLVTARDCYFHEAKIGHEFKSRAKENILERCYFVNGPTGTASYLVNVDNGGKLVMRGCMLHKGPNAENLNSIFHNTNTWGSSFNSILLEHCALVHEYATGSFIALASGTTTVTLRACLFASNGRPLVTGATPTQDSNFETTVDKLPNASNIVDPDFWPDLSIHGSLELPSAVVPTYLMDAPNVFEQRALSLPPTVIGSIQNLIAQPLPAWVQIPSQIDEETYYNTNFGPDTGKHEPWIWTESDKSVNFALPPPSQLPRTGHNIHDDTEGDDLWTHYMQTKRVTTQGRVDLHMAWATQWRDSYVNLHAPAYIQAAANNNVGDSHPLGGNCVDFDHLYGWGAIIWAIERGDLAVRNAVLDIANAIESHTYEYNPGTSSFSRGGARRAARRLMFYSYLTMMDPAPRWIAARDHIIELCLQSVDWCDSSNSAILPGHGGHHFVARSAMGGTDPAPAGVVAGMGQNQFDLGYRCSHSIYYATTAEAVWAAYKVTGRPELRAMMIEMARFILHHAWNPSHINPMCGSYWGVSPNGGSWHSYMDEYTIPSGSPTATYPTATPYNSQGPPNTPWTEADRAPTDNYEAACVNTLVYGYKLTGEFAFLKRAREHFRQNTQYNGVTGNILKQPANEVVTFIDTRRDQGQDYFTNDKGGLQYMSYIFENGGNPSLEP